MIGEIEHGQKASALAVRQRLMQAKAPTFRDRIVAINRRIQDVAEREHIPHRKIRFRLWVPDSSIDTQPTRWRRIVREVADKHKLTIPELIGRQRSKHIVIGRHEMWFRLTRETQMSPNEISLKTGKHDRTSVLYGAARHMERNP